MKNRAEEWPLTRFVKGAVQTGKLSMIFTKLQLDNARIGGITLFARGWDRFNEGHCQIMKVLQQPIAIAVSNSRRYDELLKIKERLADDNRFLQTELRTINQNKIIGADSGLKEVMDKVCVVAPLDSLVLLFGETGTGKEIIAAAIHEKSPRRSKPFIKVNCGAIPDTLIDSELFGYEKGAFTGANTLFRGRFERASGGTLLLDEIGELPLQLQVRLLRVLEEKQITRLGGAKPIPIDVRIIVATHRNLSQMVQDGRFREDLFFRINVFPIRITPLRERTADIHKLLDYFISKRSHELGLKTVGYPTSRQIEQLKSYHWPGNVREFENMVERELIINNGRPLTFTQIDLEASTTSSLTAESDSVPGQRRLDDVVVGHLKKILTITRGQIGGKAGSAAMLGLKPSTLRAKLDKLGIPHGRAAEGLYYR